MFGAVRDAPHGYASAPFPAKLPLKCETRCPAVTKEVTK